MNPTESPARPARAESNRDASFGFPDGKRRVFFGPEEASQAYRIVTEAKPLIASHACNVARRHFGFTLWSDVPPLKLLTETPDEIAAHHVNSPCLQPDPAKEVSRTIPGTAGTDYCLRFTSPCARLGDTVYARVHDVAAKGWTEA